MTGKQENCSWQHRRKRKGGIFYFGSEVGVVVALAPDSSMVPSLSVAVPLVLSALPPALMVVAPVTVGSPGWFSKQSRGERERERARERQRKERKRENDLLERRDRNGLR